MGMTRRWRRGAATVLRRVRVRQAAPVRGRVGEPEEERLRLRRPAVDEVDRFPGQYVLLEVGWVLAVKDPVAVVVQRVVVDLLVVRGGHVPLRPAQRHEGLVHVAVQVLADQGGVVPGALEPDREGVASVQLLKAAEAAVRRIVAEDAVVVHVLTGEEGGAGGAAERVVDEAPLERHSVIGDQ
jgi:hypothetical protein